MKLEDIYKVKAKENLVSSGKEFGKGMPTLANPIDKIDTREEVSKTAKVSQRATAKMLGVSDTTIIRDLNKDATNVAPEEKSTIDNQEDTNDSATLVASTPTPEPDWINEDSQKCIKKPGTEAGQCINFYQIVR